METHARNRLSIAILSDGVSPYVMGGIQRHTRMLAIHLVRAGAAVALFHSARTPAAIAHAKILDGFPVDVAASIHNVVVPYPPTGKIPGHYLRESSRYSKQLLDAYHHAGFSADFIYAQGLTGLAFATARHASPGSLPPIGVNQHGYEMFQYAADVKTQLQHIMLRGTFARLARRADFVFSFPARIREIIEKQCHVPADRIIEIPNAIDESWIVETRSMPAAVRRFVFIGRHERRKGVPELSNAILDLPGNGWEFHFVGPIPEELRIRHANVIYHGAISDTGALQQLLDRCDILVCPSFAEGMPTVVLEAMARGLAIIATDVGATAEWVDATNGVLIPMPCGSDLPSAIEAFLSMPASQLHRLQLASLTKARKYTWHNAANAVLQAVYTRVPPGQPSTRSAANH